MYSRSLLLIAYFSLCRTSGRLLVNSKDKIGPSLGPWGARYLTALPQSLELLSLEKIFLQFNKTIGIHYNELQQRNFITLHVSCMNLANYDEN